MSSGLSEESITSYLNLCPGCGGDVGSEDTFCINCGLKLSKQEQPREDLEAEPAIQPSQTGSTVYRFDVGIFYQMLNDLFVGNMQGRDGITGDDRRIQTMASNIPALGPIRTMLSTEKDFYERLINLADPAKRGFRTDSQLMAEIIAIEEASHEALVRNGVAIQEIGEKIEVMSELQIKAFTDAMKSAGFKTQDAGKVKPRTELFNDFVTAWKKNNITPDQFSAIMATLAPNFLEDGGLLDQMIELSAKFSAIPSVHFQAAYCAYQHYKRSAIATLDALVTIFKWVGVLAGKTAFDIGDSPDGKGRDWIFTLTLSRYEVDRGMTEGTVDDKTLLQTIVVGGYNIAHGSWEGVRDDVVVLISANVDALAFQIINTQVDGTWAGANIQAKQRHSQEWSKTFGRLARFVETMRPTVGPEIMLQPIPGTAYHHYDFPFYKLDRESWLGGLPSLLQFKPCYDFRIEPERGQGAVILIFADQGSGKTTIIDDLIAIAVWKGFYVIILMGDERNQPAYLSIPSFGLGREIDERLALDMKVLPHPLPTLILDVIREDETPILRHVPLTPEHRIITVPSPYNFSLENAGGFGIVVDELNKIIQDYPFTYSGERPKGGVIFVQNLNRELFGGKAIEDLAVATRLNIDVNRWREHNVKVPLFYPLDEITTVAPRVYETAGKDTHQLAGQLFRTLLNARGRNAGIVGATTLPKKVDEDFLNTATTIMIKNLAGPQVEELFRRQGGLIQFAEDAERDTVLRLNKRLGLFPEGHPGQRIWIGCDRRRQQADLYFACASPANTELKGREARDTFREANKYMKRKMLIPFDEIDFDAITIARCGGGKGLRQGRPTKPTAVDLAELATKPLGQ